MRFGSILAVTGLCLAATACSDEGVVFGQTEIATRTVIWAAGVAASSAARWLGAEADRAGRVKVGPDLGIAGHPNVFVIGDTASAHDAEGDNERGGRCGQPEATRNGRPHPIVHARVRARAACGKSGSHDVRTARHDDDVIEDDVPHQDGPHHPERDDNATGVSRLAEKSPASLNEARNATHRWTSRHRQSARWPMPSRLQ